MCAAAGPQKHGAEQNTDSTQNAEEVYLRNSERDIEAWMQLCRLGESIRLNELYHPQLCGSNSNNSSFFSSSWSVFLLH